MSQQQNGAYEGPPAPQEESGLDIQRYLQVLLKRKWLILSTLVVVLGAVAVWTFTRVKIYRATTTVLVERQAPQVLGSEVRDVVDTSMGPLLAQQGVHGDPEAGAHQQEPGAQGGRAASPGE